MHAIRKAKEYFNQENVEMVVHAGDFSSGFTAQAFAGLTCPLSGVFGECDADRQELLESYQRLNANIQEQLLELQLGDLRLAAIHGTNESIVRALAKSRDYDFVVRGHDHVAGMTRIGDALVLNPGEGSGLTTGRTTVAVLKLSEKKCTIVEL